MKFDNHGLCECCWYFCFNCKYMHHQHQKGTEECPASDDQAEEYRKDRWKKNHEGFDEEEIEIKLNSQPPHPKTLFTNEFTGGVRVTHLPTNIEVVEKGRTYREPLDRALIKLRGLVDWTNSANS